MLSQLLIGLLLAAAASLLARLARALSWSGAAAATLLGTIVYGLGGWQWAILLLAFFVLSSALTAAFKRAKRGAEEKYAKGGQRDAMQVFSNGGLAGLFVLMHAAFPQAVWPWIAYAGALAAVNADTWATELGVLDPGQPRLISSLSRRVEKGTSGGVSVVGTLASLAGAAIIGGLAALFLERETVTVLVVVAIAGLAGSLVDSLLGATVQAIYYCPTDHKETEKHPLHTCGTKTIHLRGWKWLDNDWVNIACSIAGALAALTGAGLLGLR
jgi:uncharacterized protein (TIGR00297 family)